jgi:UDP-N-acetylglucosamine acyltransferase
MKQHPTAIIAPGAKIADDVEIGPYSIIHSGAVIGSGTIIESHVVIHGCARIGSGNRFHQACAIGDLPQDFSYDGEDTSVAIGNNNVFREFCTVHRGTARGRRETVIGNNNFFMAYTHIAHDCVVGDNTVFGNAGSIAGHVLIEDHATVGPFCGVHQYCRVGAHGWMGAYSVATKDVLPFSKTVGNRARVFGPNLVGLQRKGLSTEAIKNIRKAYRFLFQSKLNTTQALERIEEEIVDCPEVDYIVQFIRSSKRGVIK